MRPTAAKVRYLLVEAAAPGATLIDIDRLVARPLWCFTRVVAYGEHEAREIPHRRDRNPLTGAELRVSAPANLRFSRGTLPPLSAAEVPTQQCALLAAVGGADEVMGISDTSLAEAELDGRSLWGAVAAPGEEALTMGDSPAGTGAVAEGGASVGDVGLDLGVDDVAREVGEPAGDAGFVGGAGADPPGTQVVVAALIAEARALPAAR